MIPLVLEPLKLTDDEAVKQGAAVKQMQDLIKRVSQGEKYRTLANADRRLLLNEGYAPDLVNNLVYISQRISNVGEADYQDQLITGYTDAAIDPSIYASQSVKSHLQNLNKGCCAFCESELSATNAGNIYQYRPASALQNLQQTIRSPYYNLAYQLDNLHYACLSCAQQFKQCHFPVLGKRYPDIKTTQEKPLFIDPYKTNPNNYLGFNPINTQVYSLDLLQAFFNETQKMPVADVKDFLIANPQQIPDETDVKNLSNKPNTTEFENWIKAQDLTQYIGFQSIQGYGLNRPELLRRRFTHLQNLYHQYLSNDSEPDVIEYRGLSQDAIKSWTLHQEVAKLQDKIPANIEQPNWAKIYKKNPYSSNKVETSKYLPLWMQSRLVYFTRESELHIKGKRRLVYLGAEDLIYGSDNPENSVFMSIDWINDLRNIIKVRNKQYTWETSFTELASSHPLEISKLFTQNELWAEGNYPAMC